MLEAALVGLERDEQVEDGTPVLHPDAAARGEGAPVAHPFDLVDDRHGGVAGQHEIGVQRVRPAPLHRTRGGNECLRHDQPAEHAPTSVVRRSAPEDVALDAFEIKRGDEIVDAVHGLRSNMEAVPFFGPCI